MVGPVGAIALAAPHIEPTSVIGPILFSELYICFGSSLN